MATDGSSAPLNPKAAPVGPLGDFGKMHSQTAHDWQRKNCPSFESLLWNSFGTFGLQRLTGRFDRAIVFYLEQANSLLVLLLALTCTLTYSMSEHTLQSFGWAHAKLPLPNPWVGSVRISLGIRGFVRREVQRGEPDTVTWVSWDSDACLSELDGGNGGFLSAAAYDQGEGSVETESICSSCNSATTIMVICLSLAFVVCLATIILTRFANSRVDPNCDSNYKKIRGTLLAFLAGVLVCLVSGAFKRWCFDKLLSTINLPSVRVDGKPAPVDWNLSSLWILITCAGFVKFLNMVLNILVPSSGGSEVGRAMLMGRGQSQKARTEDELL
jgi:hypothetical protein